MEQSEVRMRPEQLTCHASQLFDDIAQSLLHFAKSIGRCARLCFGLLSATCRAWGCHALQPGRLSLPDHSNSA